MNASYIPLPPPTPHKPIVPSGVYSEDDLYFPDSDGKPMADNTIQYRWIVTIKANLDLLYKNEPDVFVAGDLLWYAQHIRDSPRQAPDVLVVFGRPKGDRGSWQPWKEEGVVPQVVFEILSPGNRAGEMMRKFLFYDRFGVEEYYVYDPKDGELSIWLRDADSDPDNEYHLRPVIFDQEFVSPRMGIRLAPQPFADMAIFFPSDKPFRTIDEMDEDLQRAEANAERAEVERDAATERAEKLAAQLRALGVNPDEA